MATYSELTMRYFNSRKHGGKLPEATHVGEAGSRGGGPWIRLAVQARHEVVTTARWMSYGCPAAIACSEAVCDWAEGRRLAELPSVTEAMVADWVGGLPEGKEHCSRLAAEAVRGLVPAGSRD